MEALRRCIRRSAGVIVPPMTAQTLHCVSCGAAVSSESPVCDHCGARLATISCPTCFGMMFQGTKFCPHCGTSAVQWHKGEEEMACPACGVPMLRGTLGPNTLHECEKCFGIWLDTATFERLCREAEKQAAALPAVSLGQAYVTDLGPVRYRRCPVCGQLMNRVNFAHRSGVVVDVCPNHGTWFDRNELQRIILFIRSGGLDRSRDLEKAQLEEEIRRLETLQREHGGHGLYADRATTGDLLSQVVGSAGGLLGRWLRQ
jgi:Zn-finger nucleic acid-binding protein